jgi:two-component system LytT family response regulator
MDDVRVRLLVADDEPLARRLVHRYARLVDGIDIARECTNATELLTALMEEVFDAALIDIRMPGPDVFQILQEVVAVRTLPPLVFATAYDRYAVRAFEMNAVDYLVKPYTAERFARAIGRLHGRRGEAEGLSRLLRDLGPRPDRLLVPDATRMVPVPLREVDWVKAEGDYARIHSGGRSYLVSRTLNELERRLDPSEFLRIHRSAIVRLDRIREVRPEGSSRYRLTLTNGESLIVSRGRAAALKKLVV